MLTHFDTATNHDSSVRAGEKKSAGKKQKKKKVMFVDHVKLVKSSEESKLLTTSSEGTRLISGCGPILEDNVLSGPEIQLAKLRPQSDLKKMKTDVSRLERMRLKFEAIQNRHSEPKNDQKKKQGITTGREDMPLLYAASGSRHAELKRDSKTRQGTTSSTVQVSLSYAASGSRHVELNSNRKTKQGTTSSTVQVPLSYEATRSRRVEPNSNPKTKQGSTSGNVYVPLFCQTTGRRYRNPKIRIHQHITSGHVQVPLSCGAIRSRHSRIAKKKIGSKSSWLDALWQSESAGNFIYANGSYWLTIDIAHDSAGMRMQNFDYLKIVPAVDRESCDTSKDNKCYSFAEEQNSFSPLEQVLINKISKFLRAHSGRSSASDVVNHPEHKGIAKLISKGNHFMWYPFLKMCRDFMVFCNPYGQWWLQMTEGDTMLQHDEDINTSLNSVNKIPKANFKDYMSGLPTEATHRKRLKDMIMIYLRQQSVPVDLSIVASVKRHQKLVKRISDGAFEWLSFLEECKDDVVCTFNEGNYLLSLADGISRTERVVPGTTLYYEERMTNVITKYLKKNPGTIRLSNLSLMPQVRAITTGFENDTKMKFSLRLFLRKNGQLFWFHGGRKFSHISLREDNQCCSLVAIHSGTSLASDQKETTKKKEQRKKEKVAVHSEEPLDNYQKETAKTKKEKTKETENSQSETPLESNQKEIEKKRDENNKEEIAAPSKTSLESNHERTAKKKGKKQKNKLATRFETSLLGNQKVTEKPKEETKQEKKTTHSETALKSYQKEKAQKKEETNTEKLAARFETPLERKQKDTARNKIKKIEAPHSETSVTACQRSVRDPTKKCTHRCPITLERRLIEEVCNYLKAKPGTHLLSRVADVDEIRAAANELKAITYQRLKWIPFLKKHSDTFTLSGLDRPGLETVSLHQTASASHQLP